MAGYDLRVPFEKQLVFVAKVLYASSAKFEELVAGDPRPFQFKNWNLRLDSPDSRACIRQCFVMPVSNRRDSGRSRFFFSSSHSFVFRPRERAQADSLFALRCTRAEFQAMAQKIKLERRFSLASALRRVAGKCYVASLDSSHGTR